jgi:16S rRNA processing protein RimM
LQHNPQKLTVGQIGKTYGIKGWVKIHSFTQPESNILNYAPWFVSFRDEQLSLESCKQQGCFLIGKIAGYDTPEEVKKLVNSSIIILKTQLPVLKNTEYYWADLIDLDVYNLEHCYLGKIDSFFETGANDVMVIINIENKKKLMIPYVIDKIIKTIDLTQKQMIVDWQKDWL